MKLAEALILRADQQKRIEQLKQRLLRLIADTDVTLVAINSLRDEMIDAFIRLLEKERSHGFSRILRVEPAGDAVSGPAGSRPNEHG